MSVNTEILKAAQAHLNRTLAQPATEKQADEWTAVKSPINWSRILPKSDASAKNWQPSSQTQPAKPSPFAAPPMKPVNAPAMQAIKKSAEDDEKKDETTAAKNDSSTAAGDTDEEKARKEKRRPAARARAEDLLRMNTTGGALADYLQPMSFGGARAGRARHIARALGEEPSFGVKYPGTASSINYGLGGLLGAAAGAGLGTMAGPQGTALGALLGSGIGGLGGVLAGGYSRRNEMNRIKNKLEDSLVGDAGESVAANNKPVNFGTLSSILLPYAGPHRAGQADAYEALRDNARYKPGTGRNLAYTAGLVPYMNAVTAPVTGWAQNFMAKGRMSGKNDSAKPRERVQPAEHNYGLDLKAAAAKTQSARDFGEKLAQGFDLSSLQKYLPGAGLGAGAGALVGGLGGLLFPGRRRGRLGGALRGALAGAGLGGLAGGAAGGGVFGQNAQQAMGDMYSRLGDFYNKVNPVVAQKRTELPAQSVDLAAAAGMA